MSIDVSALIQVLEQDPEQRAALRRAVFGDQPDLATTLASLNQHMDELAQAQRRTAQHIDELAQAQARTEQRLEALTARVDALTKEVRELVAAQRATENNLNDLVDTVRGMNDRLARLDGESFERRYREKGQAYLSRIARRLRLLDRNELAALVDEAEDAGTLAAFEADALLQTDAVFTGLRRDDRARVHLVVEASVTVAHYDVRRARERADLLARLVDTDVVAVVAGEFAPEPVAVAAQDADVWRVTDGKAVSPSDDLERDLGT